MRFNLSAAAAAVALLTTMIVLPATASANCSQGVCVSGHDVGDTHYVQFGIDPNNRLIASPDHWNLSIPGSSQRQLGLNETQFTVPLGHARPVTIHFSLQLCNNYMGKSSCSPWANFEYTAQANTQGGGGGAMFVAVAGDEKGRFEVSTGYPNAQSATAAALKACGGGCKLLFEHQAKCVALSSVPEGKPWAVASGDNLGQAQITAQQNCSKQAPGRCKGVQARCAP